MVEEQYLPEVVVEEEAYEFGPVEEVGECPVVE